MQRNSIKKISIAILLLLAALLLLQSIFYATTYIEKISNHQKAEEILSVDLAYSWDTMDEQLNTINDLLKNKPLFDNDDFTINIYLDLANFYLNNYAFSNAQTMLDNAFAIKPIEEIENLQIKSYAYRMQGIMEFMKYNYNEAETAIMNSQRVLANCPDEVFTESYTAMNDVWLARIYEETGRLAKCKEKLDEWADSDMFTTNIYRSINLRDFVIPYYQAKCYYLCFKSALFQTI